MRDWPTAWWAFSTVAIFIIIIFFVSIYCLLYLDFLSIKSVSLFIHSAPVITVMIGLMVFLVGNRMERKNVWRNAKAKAPFVSLFEYLRFARLSTVLVAVFMIIGLGLTLPQGKQSVMILEEFDKATGLRVLGSSLIGMFVIVPFYDSLHERYRNCRN